MHFTSNRKSPKNEGSSRGSVPLDSRSGNAATCALKTIRKRSKATFAVIFRGTSTLKEKLTLPYNFTERALEGREPLERARRLRKGGLNCRPLWHFCKQKSPIPSQLPHGLGFWLSFRRWLDYWGRSARTKNWRKVRKAFYWFSEFSGFEGIGAICTANRRKGQRPFYGWRTLRPT